MRRTADAAAGERENLNYVQLMLWSYYTRRFTDGPLMMTQMGPKISRGVNISSAFVTRLRAELPAAACDRVKTQNSELKEEQTLRKTSSRIKRNDVANGSRRKVVRDALPMSSARRERETMICRRGMINDGDDGKIRKSLWTQDERLETLIM